MAIYHLSLKIGSRGKGDSAIAAAAYRAGDKLVDEFGKVSDYSRKRGVVHSEISLCANAPAEWSDRQTLWSAVHKKETAANAQLYREFEIALPKELSRNQQIKLVRKFVKKQLTNAGMCCDWSLHDKGDGNPHVHIMATVRSVNENGDWNAKAKKVYDIDKAGEKIPIKDKKTGEQKKDSAGRKQWKTHKEDVVEWNKKEKAGEWRTAWEIDCNAALEKANVNERVSCKSNAERGIKLLPTKHEGYVARKLAAREEHSDLVERNKEVRVANAKIMAMDKEWLRLESEANDLRAIIDIGKIEAEKAAIRKQKEDEIAEQKRKEKEAAAKATAEKAKQGQKWMEFFDNWDDTLFDDLLEDEKKSESEFKSEPEDTPYKIIEEQGYTVLKECKNKEIATAEIPAGVQWIDPEAFTGCYNLENVIIPDGVEVIDQAAFCDCWRLESVEMPNSVVRIGNFAFAGCESLENIKLPNGLEKIEEGAFCKCHSLNNVVIPDSVKVVKEGAFANCKNLWNVSVPADLQFDGERCDFDKVFSGTPFLEEWQNGNGNGNEDDNYRGR